MPNLHRSFEQLVQRIIALHKFESYADQKQLLELLDNKALGSSQDGDCSGDAAGHNYNIEDIPAVGTET